MIQQELDRQAADLARIARALDTAMGPSSRLELEVGRLLQLSAEQLHGEWPDDFPLELLDARTKTLARIFAHQRAFSLLASALDGADDGKLGQDIERLLTNAREARPIALEAHFHESPFVYPPDAMEKDYSDLVFETHSQILLLLEDEAEA